MNLQSIRQLVFDSIDKNPSGVSPDAIFTYNRFINLALKRVMQDCPAAFYAQEIVMHTEPDVQGSDYFADDTLEVYSTDPWLLIRTTVLTETSQRWPSDGRWDGRKIFLTTPDGQVFERRIRGISGESVTGGYQQTVALDRPWPSHLASDQGEGIEYLIATTEYYVPDDVQRIDGLRVIYSGADRLLDAIDQETADRRGFTKRPDIASRGTPQFYFRRGHFSLQGPTTAPTYADSGTQWTGAEKYGTFSYCYTYCWGKRYYDGYLPGPTNNTSTPARRVEPLWESPPSPFSAARTIAEGGNTSMRLKFPDYAFEMGFDSALRSGALGMTRRIYRRRITAPAGGTPAIQSVPDAFVLLDEISINDVTYDDYGAVTPDISRRLRTVAGYVPFSLFPRPDAVYEMRLRVTRRGVELKDDSDVAEIDPASIDLVLLDTEIRVRKKEGAFAEANRLEQSYKAAVVRATKMYSSLRSAGASFQRGIPRAFPQQTQTGRG
jgi:hypothetical protein